MPFVAVNQLEASLMQAATDPAHRPQFYRDFSASDIYVPQPGTDPLGQTGEVTLKPGEQIKIGYVTIQEAQYIPVFTSLQRLEAWIPNPVLYFRVNALDFIRMTKAAPLVLNAGADYGKTMTAAEAASIADGSIFQPQGARTFEKDTQVLLGQPSQYPTELAERLARYLRTKPQATRAWLCLMATAGDNPVPHTLVGIEASGDFDSILSEMSIVLEGVPVPNPPVDLIRVAGPGVLEDYLVKETKPFYSA